jgi:5-hydroxyisourate hydrolase-like protein (transthyretin family)
VVCVGSKKTPYCSSRGLNYIRTFKAQATVIDLSPPAVSIVQDNPFTRGEWVSGVQSVTYDASDNAGIRLVRPILANVPLGDAPRACDFTRQLPCTSGQGHVTVNTGALSQGTQSLVLQAEDAAGNPGNSGAVTARVDNSAPGTVQVGVGGGESWRNRNHFEPSWINQEEGDRAPIMVAHYRMCRVRTTQCIEGAQSGLGIARLSDLTVPAPGEWQLKVWRQDAAGNTEPANASVPVALRYDPEPPDLGFEPLPPSDPTAISVRVAEAISGLAGGQIELSKEGSNIWQTLPTHAANGRLTSRIDDSRLPSGTYLLRATARDQAGNQNTTDRRLDGTPMSLSLPLRAATNMRAGIMRSRTVRRTIRRGGRRRTIRKRVESLSATARVKFGARVPVRGVLENAVGQPLAGARVLVFSRGSTGSEQLVAIVSTDTQGRYAYMARGEFSRTLRFVYEGTTVSLPAEQQIAVLVRAASTIRVDRRQLMNGQAVQFAGQLRSLPTPAPGKLVELQVVLSGRWQTFRTFMTDSDGSWHVRYRFRRSCGLLRYRFRARLPAEAGYAFEAGRTKVVAVRVRGRPCG